MKSEIKRFGWILSSVLNVTILVLTSSCLKQDKSLIDYSNYIIIQNGGSGSTRCGALQFASITVAPTDGSSAAVGYSFFNYPNTVTNVKVKLPASATYTLQVYTSLGQSIWWDSIEMTTGGTTVIYIATTVNGFSDTSNCNGIPPDGNNLPCVPPNS